mmetsp:Transcript_11133/g.25687  ORF Transcript_11133/g.25687 Transcript_11133/m.25687 type:complete len:254 (-) Transcript_11133:505-1266(-)
MAVTIAAIAPVSKTACFRASAFASVPYATIAITAHPPCCIAARSGYKYMTSRAVETAAWSEASCFAWHATASLPEHRLISALKACSSTGGRSVCVCSACTTGLSAPVLTACCRMVAVAASFPAVKLRMTLHAHCCSGAKCGCASMAPTTAAIAPARATARPRISACGEQSEAHHLRQDQNARTLDAKRWQILILVRGRGRAATTPSSVPAERLSKTPQPHCCSSPCIGCLNIAVITWLIASLSRIASPRLTAS